MSIKNNLEQKAIKIICDSGEEGILQSKLWKKLGLTSREGSRIARKVLEKGIIEREREFYNTRWTYRLRYLRKEVTLETIRDCPCLVCNDIEKCFIGGNRDSLTCQYLTAWVDPRIKETPNLKTNQDT